MGPEKSASTKNGTRQSASAIWRYIEEQICIISFLVHTFIIKKPRRASICNRTVEFVAYGVAHAYTSGSFNTSFICMASLTAVLDTHLTHQNPIPRVLAFTFLAYSITGSQNFLQELSHALFLFFDFFFFVQFLNQSLFTSKKSEPSRIEESNLSFLSLSLRFIMNSLLVFSFGLMTEGHIPDC